MGKKKGHTFYKVVPERSQCELNGHGILDGYQDIFNRLQVNLPARLKKTTCFLTQPVVKHSYQQHKVVSVSVKVPYDNK